MLEPGFRSFLFPTPKPNGISGLCECTSTEGWDASLPEKKVFQDLKSLEKTLDFNRATAQ